LRERRRGLDKCKACGQLCKAAELEGGYCTEWLEDEADRAAWCEDAQAPDTGGC
jgi:hypothetical protein